MAGLRERDIEVFAEMVLAARNFGCFAGCIAMARRCGFKTHVSILQALKRLEEDGRITPIYKGRRICAFILHPYGYRLPVRMSSRKAPGK